jgi:hypothetical protein
MYDFVTLVCNALENWYIKMYGFTYSLTDYLKMGVYLRIRSPGIPEMKNCSVMQKNVCLCKLYLAVAQRGISVKQHKYKLDLPLTVHHQCR